MLWRDLRAWNIYGANTDVGKTIWSTILAKALARRAPPKGLLYLKPVSTGPPKEADNRHITNHVQGVVSKCISQFSDPVSPHLAARNFPSVAKVAKNDAEILSQVRKVLDDHALSGGRYAVIETAGGVLSPAPSGAIQADLYRPLRLPALLIGDSRLGGIGSTISAFESLHVRGYDVDSVLVFDDPAWGNFEFLRQYFLKQNIQTFALPLPPVKHTDEQIDQTNLAEYYETCSRKPEIATFLNLLHQIHFHRLSKLTSLSSHADSVIWHPFRQHKLQQNIIAIDSAYGDQFVSYNAESDSALADQESSSSTGLTPLAVAKPQSSILTPLFDASASWWTQGLGHGNATLALTAAHAAGRYGHVMFASAVHEPALDLSYNLLGVLKNPRLSRVFFTDNGSTGMEVAVKMALRSSCLRYGWNKNDTDQPVGILGLKGSYHGDTIGVMNCSEPSTFNEKVDWYRPWGYWFEPPEVRMKQGKWQITLPESMSNGRSGSLFGSLNEVFDFTSRQSDAAFYKEYISETLRKLVHQQKHRFGALILEPILMGAGGMILVDPLFQRTLITTIRDHPSLIGPSYDHASKTTTSSSFSDDSHLTWKGLPFIADEVFTGLYRLGRASSSSFLNDHQKAETPDLRTTSGSQPVSLEVAPDISVHAKLLTGGLLPLALTCASTSIFESFLSEDKADALLHGHSYTAHPVGCAVANKSLAEMVRMDSDGSWNAHKQTWVSYCASTPPRSQPAPASAPDSATTAVRAPTSENTGSHGSFTSEVGGKTEGDKANPIFSFFDPTTLDKLSHHPRVESCFALGTVLALTLKSDISGSSSSSSASASSTGYSSNVAASLQSRLLTTLDEDGAGVHSRILGNVIYFMTSLVTTRDAVARLERCILRSLDEDVTSGDAF